MHFAATAHEGLPERSSEEKKAFAVAFLDACAQQEVPAENIVQVVKTACLHSPAARAAFEDFLIKSSAGEDKGQGVPSGFPNAPPPEASPPATPSRAAPKGAPRGLGETPGARRFMSGLVGSHGQTGKGKKQMHPMDVKNFLAIQQIAQARRTGQLNGGQTHMQGGMTVAASALQMFKAAAPGDVQGNIQVKKPIDVTRGLPGMGGMQRAPGTTVRPNPATTPRMGPKPPQPVAPMQTI